MKKMSFFLIILLLAGSVSLFAANNRIDYANRAGQLRLGADLTMPTLFVSLDLTEFLGGPTIHYGLSDTIELKATLAPLVRTTYWLSNILDEMTGGAVSFLGIGLAEVGARLYFSPYTESWFLDAELATGFVASDYNFINPSKSFLFETAGSLLGVSIGKEIGRHLSAEVGAYLISPNLDIANDLEGVDISDIPDILIPFPKVSVTYMF